MNAAIKEMLHFNDSINYLELLDKGGIILDVRSHGEYAQGHIKNSMNLPLEELPYKLNTLNRNKTIIVCCANGFRSASAKTTLQMHGFGHVLNAGPWIELNNEVQKQK